MFKVAPIELDADARGELERRAQSQTEPARVVCRAKIILLCADGVPLRQIAPRVDLDEHQVSMWRRRFLESGLDGLVDQHRPGRPRRLGHDQRLEMAAIATSERDPCDPVATWTYFEVTEELRRRGVEAPVSQVWRILTGMDIDLAKVRGWLNRRDDPEFWDRVRDICGLYLAPPERAMVVSVDEKTSIQAKARKYPDQNPKAGRARRREFEYVRHGTVSLHAALDVHTVEVLAAPIPGKNNSEKDFSSRDDLIDKLLAFITDYHQTARPFKWTYAADPLVA